MGYYQNYQISGKLNSFHTYQSRDRGRRRKVHSFLDEFDDSRLSIFSGVNFPVFNGNKILPCLTHCLSISILIPTIPLHSPPSCYCISLIIISTWLAFYLPKESTLLVLISTTTILAMSTDTPGLGSDVQPLINEARTVCPILLPLWLGSPFWTNSP